MIYNDRQLSTTIDNDRFKSGTIVVRSLYPSVATDKRTNEQNVQITDKCTNVQTDKRTNEQMDKFTNAQTYKQTNRQTNKRTKMNKNSNN